MTDRHTICELPGFTADAAKIFAPAEIDALIDALSRDPQQGTLIPDSGGVRYMRWAAKGHGKGRGARVVFLHAGDDLPVFLFGCYFKGRKETIGPADRRAFRRLAEQLRAAYVERNRRKS